MPAAVTLVWTILAIAFTSNAQSTPAADCREWHECRQLAVQAYDRGDYEQFHDLAWRAIQTGPRNDAALMYLLARAQSLSGHAHDALVMLGRLLDRGIVPDTSTDDFRAVRALKQWPELEARLAEHAAPPAAEPPPPSASAPPTPRLLPPAAIAAAPPAPPAPPPPAAPVAPSAETKRDAPAPIEHHLAADDALRAPGALASPAGLAYDRVSGRFVVADAHERKLVIVDERSRHVMDLVTARSAGFFDITGFDIDPARGDLWVVSAESTDTGQGATALHKLQLVSGRPLERVLVSDDLRPCRLIDVAVTPNGSVFALDAAQSRLLRYQPQSHTFAVAADLDITKPTSIAPAGDRIVYVSHSGGIVRVDTPDGGAKAVAAAEDGALAGVERMRWARNSLLGIQHLPDGSRRAVRIHLVNGRAASIDAVDPGTPLDGGTAVTVSGDDFYFAVHRDGEAGGEIVIRRSRVP